MLKEAGHILSHPGFFFTLLTGHLAWILLNLPIYPWFQPWNPFTL